MNTSQLVDVVCRLFNNREQWQKQGDAKQNAAFLVAPLKVSNLKEGSLKVVKNAGDAGSIPRLGRSPGEGNRNSL